MDDGGGDGADAVEGDEMLDRPREIVITNEVLCVPVILLTNSSSVDRRAWRAHGFR